MGDTKKVKETYHKVIDVITSGGFSSYENLFKIVVALAKEDPALLVKLNAQENGVKCNVVFDAYNQTKIMCIKVVRSLTGMGLKDAKDFVEGHLPANVLTYVDQEEAENAVRLFHENGGSAHIDYLRGATV